MIAARRLEHLVRSFSAAASTMSSLPQGVYRKDLVFDKQANSAESDAAIYRIVTEMVPHAKIIDSSQMSISVVTGGITNMLFKVSFPEPADPVLVRIFGAEGMIDRDLENATYFELAEAGVAPPYYGRFGNGRVEGFLEGANDLSLDEMSDSEISPKIAREMAKLHQLNLSPQLEAHYSEPGLWSQVWAWFEEAKGKTEGLDKQGVSANCI
jgi:hypothetical protein